MRKDRKNAGFTMVELITVVAILTILMGIAAVNVIKYQRDLKAKEADSAAKELFIAAQNHLTAADALGELEDYRNGTSSGAGMSVKDTGSNGQPVINYLVAFGDRSSQAPDILEKMLPFGAIDETVRTGGSYVIHYSLQTATVLDVFYSDRSDSRFGVELTLSDSDGGKYSDLVSSFATDEKKAERRSATWNSQSGRVIGWYGGTDILAPYSDYLAQPTIKVTNGETLKVEVSPLAPKNGDLKNSSSLSLILTGMSSGAMKEIKLVGESGKIYDPKSESGWVRLPGETGSEYDFQVLLDNLATTGWRFKDVITPDQPEKPDKSNKLGGASGTFIPGEDLLIRAIAFDNGSLSNIAESATVQVNSLYGSLSKGAKTLEGLETLNVPDTVTISAFRHLENLDSATSGLDWSALKTANATVNDQVMAAKQVTDLDWAAVKDELGYDYRPVNTSKNGDKGDKKDIWLSYQGKSEKDGSNHVIRNLTVNTSGPAGLFGSIDSDMYQENVHTDRGIQNLDLVNFSVSSTNGSAGALAGEAGAMVKNVRVYNDAAADSDLSITGSVSAGGLVGSFIGSAEECSASVYVKSSGSAGGLFGTAAIQDLEFPTNAGFLRNCYSGGHTVEGKYKVKPEDPDAETKTYIAETEDGVAGRLNVMGATAGGLIGTLTSGTVQDCYSTCSAGGSTAAGGFVGSASGGSSDDKCYCTGLVAFLSSGKYRVYEKHSGLGVFAGVGNGNLKGKYLDIVNHFSTKITGTGSNRKAEPAMATDQIPAVGEGNGSVTAFDATAEDYNKFVTGSKTSTVIGRPYDQVVFSQSWQTGAEVKYPFPGTTQNGYHYGDWPIYETLVVNEKASG